MTDNKEQPKQAAQSNQQQQVQQAATYQSGTFQSSNIYQGGSAYASSFLPQSPYRSGAAYASPIRSGPVYSQPPVFGSQVISSNYSGVIGSPVRSVPQFPGVQFQQGGFQPQGQQLNFGAYQVGNKVQAPVVQQQQQQAKKDSSSSSDDEKKKKNVVVQQNQAAVQQVPQFQGFQQGQVYRSDIYRPQTAGPVYPSQGPLYGSAIFSSGNNASVGSPLLSRPITYSSQVFSAPVSQPPAFLTGNVAPIQQAPVTGPYRSQFLNELTAANLAQNITLTTNTADRKVVEKKAPVPEKKPVAKPVEKKRDSSSSSSDDEKKKKAAAQQKQQPQAQPQAQAQPQVQQIQGSPARNFGAPLYASGIIGGGQRFGAPGPQFLPPQGQIIGGPQFLQGAQFQGQFQGAQFQGAQFQGAQVQGAQVQGAQVQGAQVQGPQFQGQFQGPQFQAAQLPPQFQKAQFQGAQFQAPQFQGAQFQGLPPQFSAQPQFLGQFSQGAQFSSQQIQGQLPPHLAGGQFQQGPQFLGGSPQFLGGAPQFLGGAPQFQQGPPQFLSGQQPFLQGASALNPAFVQGQKKDNDNDDKQKLFNTLHI